METLADLTDSHGERSEMAAGKPSLLATAPGRRRLGCKVPTGVDELVKTDFRSDLTESGKPGKTWRASARDVRLKMGEGKLGGAVAVRSANG